MQKIEIAFEDAVAVMRGVPLFKPFTDAVRSTYDLLGSSEPFSLPAALKRLPEIRAKIEQHHPDVAALTLPHDPYDNQIGQTQRLIAWHEQHAPKRAVAGRIVYDKLAFN